MMSGLILSFLVYLLYFTIIAPTSVQACWNLPGQKQTPVPSLPKNCDCYVISGPDPGYFENYRFWDFRHVQLLDGKTSRGQSGSMRPHHRLPFVLLADTPFAKDWDAQKWRREGSPITPVPMVNSENNVFITLDPEHKHGKDSTHLILRTVRFENFASTAEIESSRHDILHCSVRVRLRLSAPDELFATMRLHNNNSSSNVSAHSRLRGYGRMLSQSMPPLEVTSTAKKPPPRGACAGIFTYHSKDCESDIEILTSDPPRRVRYANQPDYDPTRDMMIPGASTIADVPFPWTSWSTHRLDWLQDASRWYVENKLQDTKTYRVPDKESMIALNLWSDGGHWTGDMRVGDGVHMAIEWIEMAYNLSRGTATVLTDASHDQISFLTAGAAEHDFLASSIVDVVNVTRAHRCLRPCNIEKFKH